MEDPQPQKSSSHETTNDSPEESGWTYYLEDFEADIDNTGEQEHEHDSSSCTFGHNSCLVSDAASSTNDDVFASSSRGFSPEISSSMKMRRKEIFYDDSLEDTASSPIDSPKMIDLEGPEDKTAADSSKEREETRHQSSQPESVEEDELSHQFAEKDNEGTDLKKGLFLVPLSMLVSYFG